MRLEASWDAATAPEVLKTALPPDLLRLLRLWRSGFIRLPKSGSALRGLRAKGEKPTNREYVRDKEVAKLFRSQTVVHHVLFEQIKVKYSHVFDDICGFASRVKPIGHKPDSMRTRILQSFLRCPLLLSKHALHLTKLMRAARTVHRR